MIFFHNLFNKTFHKKYNTKCDKFHIFVHFVEDIMLFL